MDKLIFSITISTLCFLFNYSSYRDLVQQQQCATSLNHHSIQYDCDSHTQASPVVKKQTTTTLNRAGEPWFSWWSPNIEKKECSFVLAVCGCGWFLSICVDLLWNLFEIQFFELINRWPINRYTSISLVYIWFIFS